MVHAPLAEAYMLVGEYEQALKKLQQEDIQLREEESRLSLQFSALFKKHKPLVFQRTFRVPVIKHR